MFENKKINLIIPVIFAGVLALGMFLGYKMPAVRNSSSAIFFQNNKEALPEVLDLLKYKYVDSISLDEAQETAIMAMLKKLDPHTVYIPANLVKQMNQDLEGNFEGIGIEFNILHDTVHIMNVIPGGPSEMVGLLTGDKILYVNDTGSLVGSGISSEQVRSQLLGPSGTMVKTTIQRGKDTLSFQIKRGRIPLYSVDASYVIAENTGYIRISKFSATTYTEFMQAMRNLEKQGITKLIVDLRQNGGGYLDAAIRIADELIEDQKLILYTEGKGYPRQDYRSTKPGLFEKGDLRILIDEGSASASEILAGAIQDHKRGTLLGRRSFGKGLVQEQFSLRNGANLRLTVARYYLPSGRSIQKSYENGREAYDEEVNERYLHGELNHEDSMTQGGGIVPDIFVPLDTSKIHTALVKAYQRNLVGNFAYLFYSKHKESIQQQFPDLDSYYKNYQIGNEQLQAFFSFAAAEGITLPNLYDSELADLKLRLKALIARQLWQSTGFYRIANDRDEVVQKAIESLQ